MFRLERSNRRNSICLTLEGELKSESVEAAESACFEALESSPRVKVLVKNVTEIDREGYAFLKRLVMTKAQVRAIGIYSRYVLRTIKAKEAV